MAKFLKSEDENPLLLIFDLGLQIDRLGQKLETDEGISVTQWCLLKHLVHCPASSPLGLARSVGIQPCSLTQSLKRLERKGYIFVSNDPSDRRKKNLSLTREGKEALDRADRRIRGWMMNRSVPVRDFRKVRDVIETMIVR